MRIHSWNNRKSHSTEVHLLLTCYCRRPPAHLLLLPSTPCPPAATAIYHLPTAATAIPTCHPPPAHCIHHLPTIHQLPTSCYYRPPPAHWLPPATPPHCSPTSPQPQQQLQPRGSGVPQHHMGPPPAPATAWGGLWGQRWPGPDQQRHPHCLPQPSTRLVLPLALTHLVLPLVWVPAGYLRRQQPGKDR